LQIFRTNAEFLVARLSAISETQEPNNEIDIIADNPDSRLLELAKISNADFIITGNTNDFKMKNFFNTRIVTPREYWEEYKL